MSTPSKLYKLNKERSQIAGVTVKGNGTCSHNESGTAVRPQGGLRPGKTCLVGIEESFTFQLEEATVANVPSVGAAGATEFDAQELVGGTARGAGIKCSAVSTTVMSVRRTFNTGGQPVIEVEVAIDSPDEEASGVTWAVGAA